MGIVQIERKRERGKREKDAFVLMAAEGGEERKKGREGTRNLLMDVKKRDHNASNSRFRPRA